MLPVPTSTPRKETRQKLTIKPRLVYILIIYISVYMSHTRKPSAANTNKNIYLYTIKFNFTHQHSPMRKLF